MSIYLACKRFLDVSAASAALLVCAPLLAAIALAVRLTMGSPVLFRQTRAGLHCLPFTLIKFRTMSSLTGDRLAIPDRDRMPVVGRVLRATSLDELPTLINVVTGDMSLVGPRPLLMEYLPYYGSEYIRRHEAKPGITGLAQINGRQALKFSSRFKMDVHYVDHRSMWMDLSILGKTFLRIFRRADGIADTQAIGEVDDIGLSKALKLE